MMSGYRHVAVMVKDKSTACFNEALAHVIDFYNLHGHAVKKIRFDAKSTKNVLETVQFVETNRIQVDPPPSSFSQPELLEGCCRILGSYCESHHWLLQR